MLVKRRRLYLLIFQMGGSASEDCLAFSVSKWHELVIFLLVMMASVAESLKEQPDGLRTTEVESTDAEVEK